jgi:asparagine synthetase B (glutamine-hydrolysing)
MSWTFERVFYGHKGGLNVKAAYAYLAHAFYPIPETLFEGYYRAVYRTGDHDSLYGRISKPFPDALEAQRPSGKFAMHLSGGFDSSILAKLYDRPDVDYIHFTGRDSPKARALAATLQGTLHEIQITPELFIREADELCPLLLEPYAFEDIVYAYIASKKAKELGHSLVMTGDGGDWVFGGYLVGPNSQLAADVWKTLEPHRILGVQTSAPLAHEVLELWSKASLDEKERAFDKAFARRYCQELGMPEEVVTQRKTPWSGTLGIQQSEMVTRHVESVVDESDYRWIRRFEFVAPPRPQLWFRQYSLVKWLRANYKEHLSAKEIEQFTQQAVRISAEERKRAKDARRKELIHKYCPRRLAGAARRVKNKIYRA